jgi:hypothetical protein
LNQLKPFVNNPAFQEAIAEYVKNKLDVIYRTLESVTTERELFKAQGQISVYKRLLTLKEEVNGEDNGVSKRRR